MKMRKLVAVLAAVMMLFCIIPFSAVAESNSATIDFTDKANRTSYSTSQQIWEQNGIVVTNDKGASTSNVGDYGGEGYPARFYKSSTVKIEYPGMTKIVIDCGDLEAKYVDGWTNSFSAAATATKESNVVTIVLAEAADAFVWETLSAQSRAYSITVYGEGGIVVPDVPVDPEPDVPVDPEPDVPVEPASSAIIEFTDKLNRTFYSAEQQIWSQNGIVVTNDKGASTSNVGDYGGDGYPARFYKSSTVKIEYFGITKIVIDCGDLEAKYVDGWTNSFSANATATKESNIVTIVLAEAADVFVWETLSAQSRAYSITVYGEGGIVVPDVPVDPEPDVPVDPEPDVPVEPASSATLDLTDKANRVSYSSSQQVWKQNGITVTNDKGASTTNVGDYANPGRFYKSSTVKIEYPGMTKIVIDSVTYADNDYAAGWTNSFTAAATATVVDGDVTIVLDKPMDSFVWETLSAQSRAYTITVYTGDAGTTPDVPDVPVDPSEDPEADTELSIADAIALGLSKEHNVYTDAKYYVTGVISEVYNTQYGNMKLTDEAGNILTIYGSWSEDGNIRYDALENAPVAGDTVTLYGIIGQYNGTAQMKNGWIIGSESGDTPDVPVEPSDDLTVVTNPVVGTAYKFGMIQANVSSTDVYYLIGGMAQTYYMATAADASAAIDVYLEKASGGYYLYAMVNGVKQYINMVVSGTHVNGAYASTASTVYTFDADYQTVIAEIDGAYYWFGTRNDKNYTTVGPCNVEYAGFYCQFYAAAGSTPDVPVNPDPDVPVNPSDEIETDYPFLFGMTQYNVSEEDVYFLNGKMNSYYMDTTTNPDEAIVVYVEATNGGYYFYTYDGNKKLYINMVVSGTHVNGAYEAIASTVYRYDAEAGTLIADVDGADYWFGTRNDKNYTTVGPCKVEYEGFYCEFYYFSEDDECDHEYDNICDVDCNLCGDVREVGDHIYDNDRDADCNACGAVREIDVPDWFGIIKADNVTGKSGDTVKVTVSYEDNPGIISTKVKVHFDTSVLKFVGYEAGNFSAGGYSWSDADAANEKGYFIINWCDAIHGDSTADLLATLSFEILADAAEGTYPITLEVSCEDDVFNAADETVWASTGNGSVTVANSIAGDANGDGKVNNRDLGVLQQYLNEWDVTVDVNAADLNGDGRVNNRDLGLLQQLLNA